MLRFPAPVGGRVQAFNGSLADDPAQVSRSPYRDDWTPATWPETWAV